MREKMVKQAKVHAEKAKVEVRRARQSAISDLKKQRASEDTTWKLKKHVSKYIQQSLCLQCNVHVYVRCIHTSVYFYTQPTEAASVAQFSV